MFVIEDERHAELQDGEFTTLQEAVSELKRRAEIPWDEEPNRAPCRSWETCGRTYVVIEYDDSHLPWTELSRTIVLKVSATGMTWLDLDL